MGEMREEQVWEVRAGGLRGCKRRGNRRSEEMRYGEVGEMGEMGQVEGREVGKIMIVEVEIVRVNEVQRIEK